MRLRLLSVALLLLGFWCLGHQETARSQWLLGVGKTVGASCAGFSIDGAATSQPATGSTTTTQALTIAGANEVIFSIITENAQTLTSTTDNSGHTAAWTSPRAMGGTANGIYESWTTSTGAFSGATVTSHYAGNTGFTESIVFGVIGSHPAAPFDSGGSSNVPQPSTGASLSVNINAVNSLALGFFRDSGVSMPQSGWTQIAATASFTLAQFKAFTSQQTGLSVSDPNSGPNGGIADAIICGP